LVSGTACAGDTLHFFDISEVLAGVDSYFWQFGDDMVSTARDPLHIYSAPGIFSVTPTATSQGCQNISLAKQVQIQRCKKSDTGDIFDLVRAYPNPAAAAFTVDISLNEPQIERYQWPEDFVAVINGATLVSGSIQRSVN
jgi:PKD repeat protein